MFTLEEMTVNYSKL